MDKKEFIALVNEQLERLKDSDFNFDRYGRLVACDELTLLTGMLIHRNKLENSNKKS